MPTPPKPKPPRGTSKKSAKSPTGYSTAISNTTAYGQRQVAKLAKDEWDPSKGKYSASSRAKANELAKWIGQMEQLIASQARAYQASGPSTIKKSPTGYETRTAGPKSARRKMSSTTDAYRLPRSKGNPSGATSRAGSLKKTKIQKEIQWAIDNEGYRKRVARKSAERRSK